MTAPSIRLRNGRLRDLSRMVQLLTDPRVRRHLGGPRARMTAWPLAAATLALTRCAHGRWAQVIANPSTGTMLGTVMVDRRRPDRPGHVLEGGRELELSYVLLPDAWGRGLAEQACRALLADVAGQVLDDQPVLVVTQTSNTKALALAHRLGFETRLEFTEFGSAQQLLTASLAKFRA